MRSTRQLGFLVNLPGSPWALVLVPALSAGYFACFFSLQWMKLSNYDPTSHDIVNLFYMWGELLDWVQGRQPSPNLGGILSAPLYGLLFIAFLAKKSMVWPVLYTVLPASLSLVVFYLLAQRVLRDTLWSLLMTGALAFFPLLNVVSLIGLRESPLFMLLFFLEIYFLVGGRKDRFLLFVVLANLSRMNAILVNVLLGVALSLRGQARIGVRTAAVSLLMAAGMVGAIWAMGFTTGEGFSTQMIHLDVYGSSLPEALARIVMHPGVLLRNVWIPENRMLLAGFLPLLPLPVFAPLWLLPCLGDVVYTLLTAASYRESVWMTNLRAVMGGKALYHNNLSYVIPVVFVAALFGLRRVLTWCRGRRTLALALALLFVSANALFHYECSPVFGGPIPFSREFNWHYYTKSGHAERVDEAWRLVPDGSRIWLKENLMGHEVPRMNRIDPLQFQKAGQSCDYVLADLFSFSYVFDRAEYLRLIRDLLERGDLELIFFEDGVLLFQRGQKSERNRAVLDFLDDHRADLARNLFNPYVLGDPPGDGRTRDVHSGTQLVRHDAGGRDGE